MNAKMFSDAMSELDAKYVDEALSYNAKASRSPRLRHVSMALMAAILALLLMGAGFAAVVYGDSIQSWFGHYWKVITGQSMSEGQTEIIERLSQDIGMSQTVDDVTVTVDSATIGNNNLFILLKVKGLQHNNNVEYDFGNVTLIIAPDSAQDQNSVATYGIRHREWDGDGTALLLMEYSYISNSNNENDTSPINITLTLTDLLQNGDKEPVLEGEWTFDFSLDRSKAIQVMHLPDTEVTAFDADKNELVPVVIKNIELSSTGFNFQYDYQRGTLSIEDRIQVMLNSGKVVEESGGSGTVMEDGTTLNCSHQWRLPIDLNEISAVKIGEVIIPVSFVYTS